MNLIYRTLRRISKMLLKNKDAWYSEEPGIAISKKRKTELKKLGFYASTENLFDFNKYGYDAYVNFRDYRKLHPINGSYSQLIDDKSFIPIIFKNLPQYVPDFHANIHKGKLLYSSVSGPVNIPHLLNIGIQNYDKLFLRPLGGSRGHGTVIVNKLNAKDVGRSIEQSRASFSVTNYMNNEEFLNSIFPHSLNTMRVLFFRNDANEMEILKMCIRFGTTKSAPVDNFGAGGMIFSVDETSGGIGYGRLSQDIIKYSNHVESYNKISGLIIPNWQDKLIQINEIINNLNYLIWGGLDVSFTDRGLKVMEINSLPSMSIQLFEPLLINEKIRAFMLKIGYKNCNQIR